MPYAYSASEKKPEECVEMTELIVQKFLEKTNLKVRCIIDKN